MNGIWVLGSGGLIIMTGGNQNTLSRNCSSVNVPQIPHGTALHQHWAYTVTGQCVTTLAMAQPT